MPNIEFSSGEELSAAKLNRLSSAVDASRVFGMVGKGSSGSPIRQGDDRNYIEPLRPFDVERLTDTKLFVRGGGLQYADGVIGLTCDDSESTNPEDIKTITPTIAASTEYYVYLILDTSSTTATLTAAVAESVPEDTDSLTHIALTSFTTTATNVLPDIDPERVRNITSAASDLINLYRVRYRDGKLQIYGVGGSDMYHINGVDIAHETATPFTPTTAYDWWDYTGVITSFDAVIYAVPVAPASGTYDYTNPESYVMRYGFVNSLPSNWTKRAAIPIAYVEVVDSVASIAQFHTGQISYQWVDTDRDVTVALGANAATPSYSIERYLSGQLQLHEFDSPATGAVTEPSGLYLPIRNVETGVPTLRWITWESIISSANEDITFPVQDHSLLSNLLWYDANHTHGGVLTETLTHIAGWIVDDVPSTATIEDIAAQIAGIIETSTLLDHGLLDGLADDDHGQYLLLAGNATRNTMPTGAKIKMEDTTPATATDGALIVDGGVYAGKGAYITDGTTISILCSGIYGLDTNGVILTDNSTAASAGGGGAITTAGGIYAGKGAYITDGTRISEIADGVSCARFRNSAIEVYFAGGTTPDVAGYLSDGTNLVVIGDGSKAINIITGDYYHNDLQGVTVANWSSGGILIGTDIIEIDASALLPTDKILVRR